MADFVRDNDNAGGAFCVAPASHKASLPVPEEYVRNPDLDPSMVGLEVKAGDVSRRPPAPGRLREILRGLLREIGPGRGTRRWEKSWNRTFWMRFLTESR